MLHRIRAAAFEVRPQKRQCALSIVMLVKALPWAETPLHSGVGTFAVRIRHNLLKNAEGCGQVALARIRAEPLPRCAAFLIAGVLPRDSPIHSIHSRLRSQVPPSRQASQTTVPTPKPI